MDRKRLLMEKNGGTHDIVVAFISCFEVESAGVNILKIRINFKSNFSCSFISDSVCCKFKRNMTEKSE